MGESTLKAQMLTRRLAIQRLSAPGVVDRRGIEERHGKLAASSRAQTLSERLFRRVKASSAVGGGELPWLRSAPVLDPAADRSAVIGASQGTGNGNGGPAQTSRENGTAPGIALTIQRKAARGQDAGVAHVGSFIERHGSPVRGVEFATPSVSRLLARKAGTAATAEGTQLHAASGTYEAAAPAALDRNTTSEKDMTVSISSLPAPIFMRKSNPDPQAMPAPESRGIPDAHADRERGAAATQASLITRKEEAAGHFAVATLVRPDAAREETPPGLRGGSSPDPTAIFTQARYVDSTALGATVMSQSDPAPLVMRKSAPVIVASASGASTRMDAPVAFLEAGLAIATGLKRAAPSAPTGSMLLARGFSVRNMTENGVVQRQYDAGKGAGITPSAAPIPQPNPGPRQTLVWRKPETRAAEGGIAGAPSISTGAAGAVMRQAQPQAASGSSPSASAATASGSGGLDIDLIAEQVTRRLARRLEIERERLGVRP